MVADVKSIVEGEVAAIGNRNREGERSVGDHDKINIGPMTLVVGEYWNNWF